jgi:hypothetical protein
MTRLLFIIAFALMIAFALAVPNDAQTVAGCPDGYVCITPAAARAALEAGDKAKALTGALSRDGMATS